MVEVKRGFGRSVAEAVSGRLLIVEVRFRFQGVPYGICGGKMARGQVFHRVFLLSPPSCHATNDTFYLLPFKD
jgi:hypothetical protein